MLTEQVEPSIGPADAAEVCEQVYGSHMEALAMARRLRSAGWIVPLLDTPRPRPDGALVVATVYAPGSFESPGEIGYRALAG